MKSTSALGVRRIANALRYSAKGLQAAWLHEAAFRQELLAAVVLVPLTLWLGLPRLDTVVLFALMAAVFITELLNSGLEALVDKTSPEHHPLAGRAKDCCSAAVLLSVLTFLGAWTALAGPTLLAKLTTSG